MKKRLLAYVCMIACIFGLTACGGAEELTDFDTVKKEGAEQNAAAVISIFADYLCQDAPFARWGIPYSLEDMGSNEEMEYLYEQCFGMLADGNAVATGVQSFKSGLKTIGGIKEIGEAEAKINGKQVIVEVPVTGEKQNAVVEIVFSNDLFMRLESVALNPTASMGQLMAKAALNTVIGMGTVFAVLILISFIISCFRFIAKFQEAGAKRKAEKAAVEDKAAEQTEAQEETAEETDDGELIAVIAAAIAASQGASSTDGFVVRSIIRR